MQQEKNLNNLQVWVTRPVQQAKILSKMILDHGGQLIQFPVITIQAIALTTNNSDLLKQLESIDYIVFVSPNAVTYGVTELLKYGEIPAHLKLVTIGQASAQKLQQMTGRTPDISPIDYYNSEALLAHKGLSHNTIKNQEFIIFRGRGGRELLADTLKERGAIIYYVEVYQRLKPIVSDNEINALLQESTRKETTSRIISLSSNEGLNNLVEIFANSSNQYAYEQLLLSPLIVVTKKMRLNAQNLGFKSDIVIADKSSNDAFLKGIFKWQAAKT